MGAKGIVGHFKGIPQGTFQPRRVNPCQKSQAHKTLRFVQRKEMSYPVAEPLRDKTGIFSEPLRYIPVHPSALLIQLIRQLPVEQCDIRLDPVLQKFVDQITVKPDAFFIHPTRPLGQDTGPVDRKPVRFQPDLFHNLHILTEAMIVIPGCIACMSSVHSPRLFRIYIPDMHPLAGTMNASFNLIGAGSGAPHKILRKAHI